MLPKKRYLLRDLAVYAASSFAMSARKKNPVLFFRDIRYFPQWWKYRKNGTGTLSAQIPWLVFEVITFLKEFLKKEMRVFEYGSGGSTVFFSQRVANIVSIEHDPAWYNDVKDYISKQNITNIGYELIEPVVDEHFAQKSFLQPADFISHQKEYAGQSFERYAKAISMYPDDSFDLIVVDGRVRASCIAAALPKLKTNGILLLDNADRTHYLAPFPVLMDKNKWHQKTFIGHFPFSPASVLNTTMLFKKMA